MLLFYNFNMFYTIKMPYTTFNDEKVLYNQVLREQGHLQRMVIYNGQLTVVLEPR